MISPAAIPTDDTDADHKVVRFRDVARLHPIPPPASFSSLPAVAAELSRRGKRRRKFRTFVTLETVAVLLLGLSAGTGISENYATESLTTLFEVVTIASAAAVAILPVIFYGVPQNSRRGRRSRMA